MQQPAGPEGMVNSNIESFKNRCDWFVVATTLDGQRHICTKKDFQQVLRDDILAGLLRAEDVVRVYSKTKNGWWDEFTPSLRGFAQQHLKLRIVYEPVWTHAQIGLLWGGAVGIGLVILNALIFYGITDPLVAICLGASVLALFIPRIGPAIAPFIFGSLGLMGKVTPVFGTLAGILVFAILGGLTGMTIGGAIGWAREEKLPRAPGVPVEGGSVAVKALLLPLIASLLAWYVYVFVLYPWAVSMVGNLPILSRILSDS
jgi:hypothetical protein